jgi:hypothetical protein
MARRPFIDPHALNPDISWPEHTDKLLERGITPEELAEAKDSLVAVARAITNDVQRNPSAGTMGYYGEVISGALALTLRETAKLYRKAGDTGSVPVETHPDDSAPTRMRPLAEVRAREALVAVESAFASAVEAALPKGQLINERTMLITGSTPEECVANMVDGTKHLKTSSWAFGGGLCHGKDFQMDYDTPEHARLADGVYQLLLQHTNAPFKHKTAMNSPASEGTPNAGEGGEKPVFHISTNADMQTNSLGSTGQPFRVTLSLTNDFIARLPQSPALEPTEEPSTPSHARGKAGRPQSGQVKA